ncbi:5-(carboxyamino)imidazole ribonucleotide synthase [Altererythrobacter sp. CC-YST694]|uniref:5-(carboxyamino)imidazole ribonucleotide synthase n=1 Tax=Altererythrobacter sp. CC-YST694 TaxID=2755038 RepID=UPI001D03236A|nr:5-(carboxyamino)imidazole ribonucleotide synthase [Altererythrobacter sp. CC-YST694]MCB5425298.1 5-(carboxyamino)imidazole ribonucleotide synthase [Altererythrobacter sp. CC-YST694]
MLLPATVLPGATIGILGGGQLGRMMAVAAAQLGYNCHIYAPEAESVAGEVSAQLTRADWHDMQALADFADQCDVITYEFENVAAGPLAMIADIAPLRPGPRVLEIAQSRSSEKTFATACGGVTAPFALVESAQELAAAIAEIGTPSILKTNRLGYDGKGQIRLSGGEDAGLVWQEIGGQPCVLEGFVTFAAEFSVILVRGLDGEVRFWDSAQNVHVGGILATSTLPASQVVLQQVAEARHFASRMAEELDYVGVLSCEFFATAEGPVFNEMAPRVHNSGHWTIEGAETSQFENHIRAICGLPLGNTALAGRHVVMRNLIGDEALDVLPILADGANHLHLYGKSEARGGRKMGHVTKVIR